MAAGLLRPRSALPFSSLLQPRAVCPAGPDCLESSQLSRYPAPRSDRSANFHRKAEVRSWPIFGWLARCGGTIFIVRGSRAGATEAAIGIEYALRSGVTVVLFPEGTSTDGQHLLPFHSFLFEPAWKPNPSSPRSALRLRSRWCRGARSLLLRRHELRYESA